MIFSRRRITILSVCIVLFLLIAVSAGFYLFKSGKLKFKADSISTVVSGIPVLTTAPINNNNKLINPDFDSETIGWTKMLGGANNSVMSDFIVSAEGRINSNNQKTNALKIVKNERDNFRFNQNVKLNQTVAKPIKISVASRADSIAGAVDAGYSIYLDIFFGDANSDYGRMIMLNTGTHDWENQSLIIEENRPILSVSFNVIFNTAVHSGTAWIDNLSLTEIEANTVVFDGQEANIASTNSPAASTARTLQTSLFSRPDTLKMGFNSVGEISEINIGSKSVGKLSPINGPLIRDIGRNWLKANDSLDSDNVADRTIPGQFGIKSTYVQGEKAIEVTSTIQNKNVNFANRPVTFYYALPLDGEWKWAEDIDQTVSATDNIEYSAPVEGYGRTNLGATGFYNRLPVSSLCRDNLCLSFAVPMGQGIITRTVYNKKLNQYFIAFDLGLNNRSINFLNQADIKFKIFATSVADDKNAMRAALARYYEIYASSFERKVPASDQGTWAAFGDLNKLVDLQGNKIASDFSIAFHESSPFTSADDENLGAKTLRYLSQPGVMPIQIKDETVLYNEDRILNYQSIIDYLVKLSTTSVLTADQIAKLKTSEEQRIATEAAKDKEKALVVLRSGVRDLNNKYEMEVFEDSKVSWCLGKCINFITNPDPGDKDINSMANYSWNQEKKNVYDTKDTSQLDGEFLDSFMSSSREYDFSVNSIKNSSVIPSFDTANKKIVIPQMFVMASFADWLINPKRNNLPLSQDKLRMANFVLPGMYWGASSFDVMGIEANWLRCSDGGSCNLNSDSDSTLLYRRAMTYTKPYGILMNTNFDLFDNSLVEKYFKLATFYGFYPSFFSPGGNNTVKYFEGNYDPAGKIGNKDKRYYLRDMALFQKYLPIIKQINNTGWRPLTLATTSDSSVRVERFGFGNNGDHYYTLRNTSSDAKNISINFNRSSLGLGTSSYQIVSLLDNNKVLATLGAGGNEVNIVGIPAGDVWVIQIKPLLAN